MALLLATSTASAEDKTWFPGTAPSWVTLRILGWTRWTCPRTANEEATFCTSFGAFVISDTGTMMQSGANLNWNWEIQKACLTQGLSEKKGKRTEARVSHVDGI